MPESLGTRIQAMPRFPLLAPAVVAAVYFLAHMATATRYGYFRDAVHRLLRDLKHGKD